VVELLGVGETSRALLAATEKGDECVIRMYIGKFVGNVPLSHKDFKKAGKKSVAREVRHYHKIYPGLKKIVWQTELNGFHCVIQPYFKQGVIAKESLVRIREVLNDKFRLANLCFAKDDMRWRHVGTFQNNLFVFDQAELLPPEVEFDDYIDRHISALDVKVAS
jgi:hypothetical protein